MHERWALTWTYAYLSHFLEFSLNVRQLQMHAESHNKFERSIKVLYIEHYKHLSRKKQSTLSSNSIVFVCRLSLTDVLLRLSSKGFYKAEILQNFFLKFLFWKRTFDKKWYYFNKNGISFHANKKRKEIIFFFFKISALNSFVESKKIHF